MSTPAVVQGIIATGECATIEFKSSLRFDLKTGKVNKELTKAVVKTLAGFLNSEGGTLLIGVDDTGNILGIGSDIATLSRKNSDYFELTLRNALAKHIGIEVSPEVGFEIVAIDEVEVAVVRCFKHSVPVFFQDGEQREFYVRDGNLTRPLHIKAAHGYIARKFPASPSVPEAWISNIVTDVLRRVGISPPRIDGEERHVESVQAANVLRHLGMLANQIQSTAAGLNEIKNALTSKTRTTGEPRHRETIPAWLEVATVRVVELFLKQLADSVGWKRLYIVSPWISPFSDTAIQFKTFLRRIVDDRTTVYVVTRRPTDDWHHDAVAQLGDTGRANIAFVDNLHAKLYTASTSNGDFALIGSANLTENSLTAHEIGVLINGFSDGKRVVSHLHREAFKIYHTPGRDWSYKASFAL